MRKNQVVKEETIHVYVNPDDLRKWADEMENKMQTLKLGELVWYTILYSDDARVQVRITTDQGWFHDREYWKRRG